MRQILVALLFAIAVDGYSQITIGAGATFTEIAGSNPDAFDRTGYYIAAEATSTVNKYLAVSSAIQWMSHHSEPLKINSIGVGFYGELTPFTGAALIAGIHNAAITGAKYGSENIRNRVEWGTISAGFGASYFLNEQIEVKTMWFKQITENEVFKSTLQLGVNYKIGE